MIKQIKLNNCSVGSPSVALKWSLMTAGSLGKIFCLPRLFLARAVSEMMVRSIVRAIRIATGPRLCHDTAPVATQLLGDGYPKCLNSVNTEIRKSLNGKVYMVPDPDPVAVDRIRSMWISAYLKICDVSDNARDYAVTAEEYEGHFRSKGYCPAGGELSPQHALSMLSIMDLKQNDTLVDLGCSNGRLVLAAARFSPVRAAIGIELSPSRIARALAAGKRIDAPVHRVSFLQSDILSSKLSDATVIWYAVRGRPAKRLSGQLISLLREQRPAGSSTRFLTAGFELPDTVGVTLTAAHVFGSLSDGDLANTPRLYGKTHRGPQFVLDYLIESGKII